MMIKIEKGIPVITRYRYPFLEMEVGDSFFVPGFSSKDMSGSLTRVRKLHPGWKFTTRTIDGGVRVWRII